MREREDKNKLSKKAIERERKREGEREKSKQEQAVQKSDRERERRGRRTDLRTRVIIGTALSLKKSENLRGLVVEGMKEKARDI